MTVTMKTADKVLKSAYLDVISEYLDYKVNPFLAKIKKTSENVSGKEIKKIVKVGVNGGVGVGSEDGELPTAYGNQYAEFKLSLKNLYGTIEITDKAIRASESKSGAITNVLNDEINSLLHAANFNFSRMIFGNGQGFLGNVKSFSNDFVVVDNINNFAEGMAIQFYNKAGALLHDGKAFRILNIDRYSKTVYVDGDLDYEDFSHVSYVVAANSNGKEITGLMSIFDENVELVYGLPKYNYISLFPTAKKEVGEITEMKIQAEIDRIEDSFGGKINFILCSSGVKRALMNHLSTYKRNIETMDIQGGYKTITFNGIPVVSDRFCPPGTMFLLNTDDFAIHQLCDWQWLESEDGRILRQLENKPVYRATLVKYCDLLCSRPWAQGALMNITEA